MANCNANKDTTVKKKSLKRYMPVRKFKKLEILLFIVFPSAQNFILVMRNNIYYIKEDKGETTNIFKYISHVNFK
jgi:hypothetical protein